MKIFITILLLAVSTFGQGSIHFDAFEPSNITHKKVWTVGQTYGDFFAEYDGKPETANHLGYGVSDGAGGLHDVLYGYASSQYKFNITGNLSDNGVIITFSPVIQLNLNQWYRFGLGLSGGILKVWVNGKLVHTQNYAGVRKTLEGGSDGNLYIGGSFHNKFGGNIARFRLNNSACPYTTDYIPDKVFDKYFSGTLYKADLVADYSSPSQFFVDTGTGLGGDRHDGVFNAYTPETLFPIFQLDPVNYSDVATHILPQIPANALAFASFNQPDSSPLTSSITRLGYTDGGSLGQLEWQAPFGWWIVGEYAFAQYNQYYNNWLQFDRSDVDLRVSRLPNSSTGLLLRYADTANLIVVSGGNGTIGGAYFVNGVPSYFNFSANSNWTTLRTVANGNLLTIFADSTQVGAIAIPASLNSNNHGLRYAGNISTYKNFTAFPVN